MADTLSGRADLTNVAPQLILIRLRLNFGVGRTHRYRFMTLSVFGERTTAPTNSDLRAVLGRAHPFWGTLLARVREHISPIAEVWAYTNATTGWGLRLRHKDRVILYMTPQQTQFLVSFVLGEKAVAAAQATRLPAAIRDAVAAAPRYAEGRGVRVAVRSARQIPGLVALAEIKWRN